MTRVSLPGVLVVCDMRYTLGMEKRLGKWGIVAMAAILVVGGGSAAALAATSGSQPAAVVVDNSDAEHDAILIEREAQRVADVEAAAVEAAAIEAARVAAEVQAAADAQAAAEAQAAADAQAAEQAAADAAAKAAPAPKTMAVAPVPVESSLIKCPAGSTANSGDEGNDTSCFPDICFHISLPDSAHPECVTAFKP